MTHIALDHCAREPLGGPLYQGAHVIEFLFCFIDSLSRRLLRGAQLILKGVDIAGDFPAVVYEHRHLVLYAAQLASFEHAAQAEVSERHDRDDANRAHRESEHVRHRGPLADSHPCGARVDCWQPDLIRPTPQAVP